MCEIDNVEKGKDNKNKEKVDRVKIRFFSPVENDCKYTLSFFYYYLFFFYMPTRFKMTLREMPTCLFNDKTTKQKEDKNIKMIK